MKKKQIINSEDVRLLVASFYTKIRKDEVLSPFFDGIKNWEEHEKRLTTFWESQFFLQTKFTGNPLDAHIKVDKDHDYRITEHHFGLWLNLWFETIDELFTGETAQVAK